MNPRLALREVAGNHTKTRAATTAWFHLGEQSWAYEPDAEREARLAAAAEQLAKLAGHRIHLRRTTRPFPTEAWAGALQANTSLTRVRDPLWREHLHAATARLDTAGHSIGHTMLGVDFVRPSLMDRLPGGRGDHAARVAALDDLLAGYGLCARPAAVDDLMWLLYRSIGLGLTPPEHTVGALCAQDIPALSEHVQWYRSRYGSTTLLVDRRTGEQTYVAVLTLGRMEPVNIPQAHLPWLHLATHMPFPVEMSTRAVVLAPQATSGRLGRRLLMIRNQEAQYAQHQLDTPPSLQRLAERARRIGDEVDTGQPVDATRVHGWHRFAVYAPTEQQCLDRAHDLATLYRQHMRAELVHPKDQVRLLREFIPGQPVANTGYARRQPVRMFAAAMPHAAPLIGDDRGDLLGYTADAGNRPVFIDPHLAPEVRERSGLSVFVAEPGAGKSTLMGARAYLAAQRGVQVTLLDPSGPLARLADMPALAGRTRVVNLTGAQPGTLAPYAMIPSPRRSDYPGDPDGYRAAVNDAEFERREFVHDVVKALLPAQLAADPDVTIALAAALRAVPRQETTTLDDLVDELNRMGQQDSNLAAKNIAGLLEDRAQGQRGRLFFGCPPAGLLDCTADLMVITMAGLQLPDLSIEREHWNSDEAIAVAMLLTAVRLAARRCYGAAMGTRKLVGLDEAHFLQSWPSGRAFWNRLARDSRKWNIAADVASQNPADILRLELANLFSTVFVGRIAGDPQVAAGALQLLGLPTDSGYGQTLAALSQAPAGTTGRLGFREFLVRDVDGRIARVRIDVSWVPDLLGYLNTTPGGAP